MKQIHKYVASGGVEPFNVWFKKLNWKTQAKIDSYIVRVALGASRKNIKPVGSGVFEIKIDYGPGYRVYFGEVANVSMLLLLGGDKGSQARDIEKAKIYWSEFCEKIKNV
jgi:putative addiction module killer protein